MLQNSIRIWLWLLFLGLSLLVLNSHADDDAEATSQQSIISDAASNIAPATAALPPAPPASPVSDAHEVSAQTHHGASPVIAAPTQPFHVKPEQISAGDTAWMLVATALVLLMTIPGVVLFYAGMVRKKNVLSTALQSFAICCLVSVIWVVVGYTLAFTPSASPLIGSLDRFMLKDLFYLKATGELSVSHLAPTIPESVYVMFQMTFAIITPALVVGAFAERIRFVAMMAFMTLWSVLVYAPIAHWVWEPSGWFASKGVLDFAGGTVVHINAGITGLVFAYMLGPRNGYGKVPFIPYNLVYTLVGASLLWVGWFGFNAGSAVAADGRAGLAMLVTQVAAAVAALTWMAIEWIKKSRVTMLGSASGAVAGLVAITPASGYVDVSSALVIGVAAGTFCYWGATGLKRLLNIDDALDVFGIHGIGGIVGAILTGVLASNSIGGVDGDVTIQAFATCATLAYSGVASWIIYLLVDVVIGMRVDDEEEHDGLDLTQHSERII